jgi:hypothetical protein
MKEMLDFVDSKKSSLGPYYQHLVKKIEEGADLYFLGEEYQRTAKELLDSGHTLEKIAEILSCPIEVIILTGQKYEWVVSPKDFTEEIKKVSCNLLTIYQMAVQKELTEIMAGKKDPRESKFVPKNPQDLNIFIKTLFQAQNVTNLFTISQPKVAVQTNVVTGQNVQEKIEHKDEKYLDLPEDKIEALKQLESLDFK